MDDLSPLSGNDMVDTDVDSMGTMDDMAPDAGSPEETAFVSKHLKLIDEDLTFFKPAFTIMEENMKFAEGIQWPGQTENDERYVADITQSVVRRRVNTLYAKNPSIIARPHQRMDFSIWDEDEQTLMQALQNPMDPMSQQLLMDVQQGMAKRNLIKKLGRTLEIVIKQQIRQQQPIFKREMKRMLRREEITGVGYIKLDYLRDMDVRPDIEAQIADMASRMAEIKHLQEEMTECGEDGDDCTAQAEELRIAIETLHTQKYILRKEGIVFRFPKSDNIIPTRNCTQLEGFVGSRLLRERFWLTDEEIERTYGVDVGASAENTILDNRDAKWSMKNVMTEKNRIGRPKDAREVFEVQDRDTGSNFTICRGYDCYLQPPAAPDIITEQFFNIYSMCFNETESKSSIFPRSTVRLMMHQQREFNRSKEALRQHRIASKPLYASAFGSMDEADKEGLAHHDAHDMLELTGLQPGQKVDDLFGMVKKHGIDPNVYSTAEVFDDVTKIVGQSSSTLGATSSSTATESTIAEASNQSDSGSNADDQDDVLSMLMNDVGHNLLINMDPQTVQKIAGPGAVWPDTPTDEIINDVYCDIVAGSSGRPNRAAEGAALQRLYPLLLQLPGMKPEWLARKGIQSIDDNVDLTDAWLDGLPPIITQVRAGAPGAGGEVMNGDPAAAPSAQGPAGVNNGPPVPPGAPPPGLPPSPGHAAATQPQAIGGMLAQARAMLRGQGAP